MTLAPEVQINCPVEIQFIHPIEKMIPNTHIPPQRYKLGVRLLGNTLPFA